mmetsp:Transcript_18689/g.28427  ORF Transcript_18689/g.28427 Transcript_18689/m.28427 type:complete len:561 (+) Transcript_18689:402-2084(+)
MCHVSERRVTPSEMTIKWNCAQRQRLDHGESLLLLPPPPPQQPQEQHHSRPLPEAKRVLTWDDLYEEYRFCLIVVILVLTFLVAVVLVLILFAIGVFDGPPVTRMDQITEALTAYTPKHVLMDESTIQHKAAIWLANVDKTGMEQQQQSEEEEEEGVSFFHHPLFAQRYAMAVFYYGTTDRDGWMNDMDWLNESLPECEWGYVACDEDGYVTNMTIANNTLRGTLFTELRLLTKLVNLDLHGNRMEGKIPEGFHQLSQLESLDLSTNKLWGMLDDSIGTFDSLKRFNISDNLFSGTFPSVLYTLPSLESLDLSMNRFKGEVSEHLSNLTSLHLLNLRQNLFAGVLPTSLTTMTNLEYIHLDDNTFSGSLPDDAQFLFSCAKLTLSQNRFTGTIPTIKDIEEENIFMLKRNQMKIEHIDWHENGFVGTIPSYFGDMTALTHLEIAGNKLSGTIPDLKGAFNLKTLDLGTNKLSGPIPHSLPPSLEYFWVQGNYYESQLPSTLGELTELKNLKVYSVWNNNLWGTISTEFGLLTTLEQLFLSQNYLNGTIPTELGLLTRLSK